MKMQNRAGLAQAWKKALNDRSGSTLAEVMAAGVVLAVLALLAAQGFLLSGKLMEKGDALRKGILDCHAAFYEDGGEGWETVEIQLEARGEAAVLKVRVRHFGELGWVAGEEEGMYDLE